MAKQLLLNRGFENELDSYITQGSVSTNDDIAYSGIKSAMLIATPTSIAEISQVVFFIPPSSSVKFSFFARGFHAEDVQNKSNIRAEVNFINPLGMVVPPGIVITIRGRDISKKVWNCYEGYAEAPLFSIAAQVVIRLEPPASGSSSLLVDDLALVAEVAMPAAPPTVQVPQVQQGYPSFPGLPFAPPAPAPASQVPHGVPAPPVFSCAPPPTAQAPQVPQGFPVFSGFPFTPPPAPVPPVQQQNPAFPGFPLTNQPFAGLTDLLFPGSPMVNPAPEVPGAQKQEDHCCCQSKGGDIPDYERKKEVKG